MELSSLLRPGLVFPELEGSDLRTVLHELTSQMARAGAVQDADQLFGKLMEREELGSTAIGGGVALPHCKLDGLDELIVAVGRVPSGIDLDAPDGEPVTILFLVVAPSDAPVEHLQCLAALSKWIRQDSNLEKLEASSTREEICRCLESEGIS